MLDHKDLKKIQMQIQRQMQSCSNTPQNLKWTHTPTFSLVPNFMFAADNTNFSIQF